MKFTLRNLALSSALLAVLASFADNGVQRAGFAYGLEAVQKAGDVYTVNFKASTNGTATIVLTNGEKELVYPLGEVKKGANSVDLSFNSDEAGEYTWSIKFESTVDANQPEYVVKDIWDAAAEGHNFARGGVVTINDPEYDSFGYTLVGAGRATGIAIYTPAGEHVTTLKGDLSPVDANNMPMRGG